MPVKIFRILIMKLNKGKLHIYFGEGKGKTSAALGLIMRSRGWDIPVCLVQFDKVENFNAEYKILKEIGVEFYCFGINRVLNDQTFRFSNQKEDFNEAEKAIAFCREIIIKRKGLLVIDEILSCVLTGLISKQQVEKLVDLYLHEAEELELVFTGQIIWENLSKHAHLISKIENIKHYYNVTNKLVRKGIEY
jgi:cob(I)alamin adenosyltransferase